MGSFTSSEIRSLGTDVEPGEDSRAQTTRKLGARQSGALLARSREPLGTSTITPGADGRPSGSLDRDALSLLVRQGCSISQSQGLIDLEGRRRPIERIEVNATYPMVQEISTLLGRVVDSDRPHRGGVSLATLDVSQ